MCLIEGIDLNNAFFYMKEYEIKGLINKNINYNKKNRNNNKKKV